MKPKSIISVATVCAFLSGGLPANVAAADVITAMKPEASQATQVRRAQLIGTWYGDQPTKNGGRRQWIMRRAANGTFQVIFRILDRTEREEEQTEFGDWGLNASYLVTVTRGFVEPDGKKIQAQSADSYLWDVYEIQKITGKELWYRSVETGNSFQVKKVPDDFRFPKKA